MSASPTNENAEEAVAAEEEEEADTGNGRMFVVVDDGVGAATDEPDPRRVSCTVLGDDDDVVAELGVAVTAVRFGNNPAPDV